MRNLEQELRDMGLTDEQVINVMMWTETLPLLVYGNFIAARIEWGKVIITQRPMLEIGKML